LILEIAEKRLPLSSAPAWGHQMIARAFGGEVVSDLTRKEMGSIEVKLNSTAYNDALFGRLPETFTCTSGHKDHVSRLPVTIEPLASTELSPYQAIRVKICLSMARSFMRIWTEWN
jgi:GMP synthase (glutamine-hydrolysing)